MLLVGEDLRLVRQIGAAGIHQIDARQLVLARDLLRAQMLLHRDRIIGAALDRRVVADDHAFAPRHPPDPGDDAGGVDVALIHPERRKRRELEEGRARIDQPLDPFARQQFAAFGVAFARALIAPERGRGHAPFQLFDERLHRCRVGLEYGAGRRRGALQNRHRRSMASAVASPPPMQRLATPRFRLRRFNAFKSVTTIRAPEAPIGWPSAQAPPLTLTLA